jgi:hypothetical protein
VRGQRKDALPSVAGWRDGGVTGLRTDLVDAVLRRLIVGALGP